MPLIITTLLRKHFALLTVKAGDCTARRCGCGCTFPGYDTVQHNERSTVVRPHFLATGIHGMCQPLLRVPAPTFPSFVLSANSPAIGAHKDGRTDLEADR